jgi:hypothetical protein
MDHLGIDVHEKESHPETVLFLPRLFGFVK